jgi:hypothetical protein
MKKSSGGITMVAVALGAMALVPACGMEGDDAGTSQPLIDPATPFPALQGNEGDSSKACPSRADWASSYTLAAGSWGGWASCYSICPAGSFAYAAYLRSESSQGADDDTALNGIQLDCFNRTTGAYAGFVTSGQSNWGSWRARGITNPFDVSNPFVGGQALVETPRGGGDDTAANRVNLVAKNGTWTSLASGTGWGTWQPVRSCAAGQAICGVSTRVEGSQGFGDDSALNGIAFACCNF